MFNGFDYFIFGLLLLGMVRGWRLGFIKSISSIFILLVALAIAAWYAAPLGTYMEELWAVQSQIRQWLVLHFPLAAFHTDLSVIGIEVGKTYFDTATTLAAFITLAISFIIIMLLVNIAGNLAFSMLHKQFTVGVLKELDGVLGMVFQAAKLLLILVILLGLIYEPLNSGRQIGIDVGQGLVDLIDRSKCGGYLLAVFYQLKAWVGAYV